MAEASDTSPLRMALRLAIACAAGAALFVTHHPIAACAALGISAGVFLVSMVSKAARRAIESVFRALGRATGAVILTAVYLLVVTPVRVFRRLLGADDLGLRDRSQRTYW